MLQPFIAKYWFSRSGEHAYQGPILTLGGRIVSALPLTGIMLRVLLLVDWIRKKMGKFSLKLPSFIHRGSHKGQNSETLRKVIMLNLFLMIGFVLLMTMGVIAIFQGAVNLGVADFIMAGVFLALLFYLHKTGDEPNSSLIGVFSTLFFFFYLFFIGGVHNTAYMWLYSLPLFSLYLLGLRRGTFVVCLLFTFCTLFLIFDLLSKKLNVYDIDFAIRFIPSYLCVCLLAILVESSRFQTRQALEEARRNLEDRVAVRTKELELANEQLRVEIREREAAEQERLRLEARLLRSEKMESLGRLAGGVAHDLNNVLSGIVSYPDLLLLQIPQDSEMRGPLENIRRSGKRAAAIVDDLLSLARRGITLSERVDLNEVILGYLQSPDFAALRENHPEVSLETLLVEHPRYISGSMIHLEKLLMNLVANSFEAIEGAGVVTISTRNQFSDQGSDKGRSYPAHMVLLEVADTGVGIAEENLDRIFEPFYSSKVLGRSGTGLGMMVVWGTVTDHGGQLEIDSNVGQGTTITASFPALAEIPSDLDDNLDQKQHLKEGRNQKILIVDDLADQRSLGEDMLRALGYRVTSVESGEAALALLQEEEFSLVLLDMVMEPGIDGLDTYRGILEINPKQPVVLASGFCESDRAAQCLELGVRSILKKPYTTDELAKTLSQEIP